MWLKPVFSCPAVCCRWGEEASLVLSCVLSGLVLWCILPLLKKKKSTKTVLAQHYAIGLTGSLPARLLVTNWALKQKETLKGQTRPDSLCWLVSHPSQPDSSPPQTGFQALQGLAGDRQHSGLLLKLRSTWPPAPLIGVSLTRTLQGLQSSTGHQSCQGQTSIMSRRAWRNKSSTTHIKALTGTHLKTLAQL